MSVAGESSVFTSPYLPLGAPVRWLRGNHHGHSTVSDGIDSPEANIAAYENAGYDYLALSEHDIYVDPAMYRAKLLLLPAVEVTSRDGQTLMWLGATADLPDRGALALDQILAFVRGRGGLFICDHPNWLYRPDRLHATTEELLAADGLSAIEIYTGVIERLRGQPHALDVWDRLLTAGRRVYGHATDDQHRPIDRFLGWNSVQWPAGTEPTASGIIDALAAGRFVASTGVTVESIGTTDDGRTIAIRSDAEKLWWIITGGVLADTTEGGSGQLAIEDIPALERLAGRGLAKPDPAQYVRIECVGRAGTHAWTQPFFMEGTGP